MSSGRSSVTIRPARLEDQEAFHELRLEALREHPEAFSADYEANLAQPPEYWRMRLVSNIDNEEAILYFAAVQNRLVGMTGIRLGNSPKTRHEGTIWGVYVRPAWRGLHIAEGMIEQCLSWARKREARLAKLGVTTTNVPAIRAYLRAGFSVYGVDPETIYTNGAYYDELMMVKRIL